MLNKNLDVLKSVRAWWMDTPYHCRPNSTEDDYTVDLNFTASANPGAYRAVQLMLAPERDITLTGIKLNCEWSFEAPALFGCDRFGSSFCKKVKIEKNTVWPLWLIIHVPTEVSGDYSLRFTVTLEDGIEFDLCLDMAVNGELVFNGGENDLNSLARLSWLNSISGTEDTLIYPYTAVTVKDGVVSLLGRDIEISAGGLPSKLITYFTGFNDVFTEAGDNILREPVSIEADVNGKTLSMTSSVCFTETKETGAAWRSEWISDDFTCEICGRLEFDGWMNFDIKWKADKDLTFDDIRLIFKPKKKYARWFMGVGTMAVKTPDSYTWKWDKDKQQDGFYITGVNGGMVVRPIDAGHVRPYCNIYFKYGYKNYPSIWANNGKGSFGIRKENDEYVIGYSTGAFSKRNDDSFNTNFEIGFTPYKPTNPKEHYKTKYFHPAYRNNITPQDWLDKAVELGASHLIVHHAKDVYPFINYPMFDAPAFLGLCNAAHSKYLKIKPYYTIRELTSKLPEFFPMRSLGNEIFAEPNFNSDGVSGQGPKDEWLQKECGNKVLPAWKAVFETGKYAGQTDPSVIVNPTSRIENFYIEGLRWMCDNFHIDGIYVDDTGFDRHSLKRVRRVLDGRRPGSKIDFHSWRHFVEKAGWGHNAVIYAENFPYLDSLWFGEGFDFEKLSPEIMLIETSGITFGLMSEMLQAGGNPWRGLLFGMTNRAGWASKRPWPEGIWKWREDYGIADAKIRGWWEDDPLVTAESPEVYITAYQKDSEITVVAASFSNERVKTRLDLSKIGFVPMCARLPFIKNIQEATDCDCSGEIEIDGGEGVVVWYGNVL